MHLKRKQCIYTSWNSYLEKVQNVFRDMDPLMDHNVSSYIVQFKELIKRSDQIRSKGHYCHSSVKLFDTGVINTSGEAHRMLTRQNSRFA